MSKKSIIQCGAGLFLMMACAFSTNAASPEQQLEKLPAAVQQTIRAELGDGKLNSIDQSKEDGSAYYDVVMARQGKTRNFTVREDGSLLDTQVFAEELPPAVQEAVNKETAGAVLGEIDKYTDSDGTNYDFETTSGGTNRDYTVDSNGKLTAEEVFLGELSEDFQVNIRTAVGAGKIDQITKSYDEGGPYYDVDVTDGGKSHTFTFDVNGKLVSKSEEVALSSAPEAVQKQIQTLSAGGKILSVSKVTENGAVSFDADIRQNEQLTSYTVAEDGTVTSTEK